MLHDLYSGRIVSSGDPPMILMRHPNGGITMDFVKSQDARTVNLLSGGHAGVNFVIGAAPGTANSPTRRGRFMWEVVSTFLTEAFWHQVNAQPGILIPRHVCEELTGRLLTLIDQDGLIIAGKETPYRADAPFIPLSIADQRTWEFDWINDAALPRDARMAQTYGQIRVFTPAEWLSELGVPPVQTSELPRQKGNGKGGRSPSHDWTAFAREMVRIGWNEGFTTRRDLTKKMRAWCAEQWAEPPDESTIRKEVMKLCPDDVPDK